MSESETTSTANEIQACILAGGQSSRMGQDKAKLSLDGRTLLEIAQETIASLGIRSATIRDDIVPKCGPLSGILTAFAQYPAARILFLPCDMPFVSTALLHEILKKNDRHPHGACADQNDLAGFPMLISRGAEQIVREQVNQKEYSLQKLVRKLDLRRVQSTDPERELFNLNRPEDLVIASDWAKPSS